MLAIVGYGEHVKRNIIPALERMKVNIKHIFVRSFPKDDSKNNFVLDYDVLLNDIEVTHVYIATPITSHFELARKAIIAKKNVLVEKPITFYRKEASLLYQLSEANDCYLEEVVMYKYHNQFDYIKTLFISSKYGELLAIKTKFCIPHLDSSNIRYKKQLGGGALYDVGFYPISLIQLLDSKFKLIKGITHTQENYNVDLNGCALFTNGKLYGIAEWSIGRTYANELELEFEGAKITIERVFSKTYDLKTKCIIKIPNIADAVVIIYECDHFVRMFESFLSKPCKFVSDSNQTVSRIGVLNEIMKDTN